MSMTLLEIEPATFWRIAQCLYQLHHHMPFIGADITSNKYVESIRYCRLVYVKLGIIYKDYTA
jgi:hypothetical protein